MSQCYCLCLQRSTQLQFFSPIATLFPTDIWLADLLLYGRTFWYLPVFIYLKCPLGSSDVLGLARGRLAFYDSARHYLFDIKRLIYWLISVSISWGLVRKAECKTPAQNQPDPLRTESFMWHVPDLKDHGCLQCGFISSARWVPQGGGLLGTTWG